MHVGDVESCLVTTVPSASAVVSSKFDIISSIMVLFLLGL